MRVAVLRLTLLGLAMILGGCAPSTIQAPRSQLETRQMQSREFPTKASKEVMKAVLNALQDEGFIIDNAVSDLGLISAHREEDSEPAGAALFGAILGGPEARWRKAVVREATANISTYGEYTRVRLSLHEKVLDNRGGTLSTQEVRDSEVYRQLFSKVDKSIFLQGEDL